MGRRRATVLERPVCTDPRCSRGWLGGLDVDRPVPCLTCRPHLHTAETLRMAELAARSADEVAEMERRYALN